MIAVDVPNNPIRVDQDVQWKWRIDTWVTDTKLKVLSKRWVSSGIVAL